MKIFKNHFEQQFSCLSEKLCFTAWKNKLKPKPPQFSTSVPTLIKTSIRITCLSCKEQSSKQIYPQIKLQIKSAVKNYILTSETNSCVIAKSSSFVLTCRAACWNVATPPFTSSLMIKNLYLLNKPQLPKFLTCCSFSLCKWSIRYCASFSHAWVLHLQLQKLRLKDFYIVLHYFFNISWKPEEPIHFSRELQLLILLPKKRKQSCEKEYQDTKHSIF